MKLSNEIIKLGFDAGDSRLDDIADKVAQLEADKECPVCDRMIPVYLERRLSPHMRGDEPCIGSNMKVMGILGNES